MSNEFGREAHWQIVRTDAAQPWHARLVSNYRTIMVSENYTRRRGALRAIELASPGWLASKTPLEVDERDQHAEKWWITTHFFDKGGEKIAGPFPDSLAAIEAREIRERAEGRHDLFIDCESNA